LRIYQKAAAAESIMLGNQMTILMKIQYCFDLPLWDNHSVTTSIRYWESQRFECHENDQLGIEGQRGSYWGNLTSFDMTRLICSLTISHSSLKKNIATVFHVNTFGQDITEWNKASFQIEMLMYRRVLLNRTTGKISDEFKTDRKKAAFAWTLSGMLMGRKLKSKWQQMLQDLADDTELPTIDYIT
jgi:hypothetical protein